MMMLILVMWDNKIIIIIKRAYIGLIECFFFPSKNNLGNIWNYPHIYALSIFRVIYIYIYTI